MAQFALDALASAGVERAVANIHHLAERARAGLLALDRPPGLELEISDESTELLGSGGGIRRALPSLGAGAFFLVNADVLCDVDLGALARAHALRRSRFGALLTLTVFDRPYLEAGERQAEKYREIRLSAEGDRISGLGEPAEGCPFFTGVAVIEPEALKNAPPGGAFEMVPHILRPAIEAGRAGAFVTRGRWHDVGSPELWRRTHLSLIRALETGRLAPAWRRRIEVACRRVGPEIWVRGGQVSPANWAGPTFWDSLGDQTAPAPREVEAGCVWYGRAPEVITAGIGFRGAWRAAPTNSLPG
jgi:NDP-sugar pyrophosphorylase family protein